MRGKKAGAYSGGGTNTLTMNPTANFYPGEVVEVTLTNGLTDGSAQALTPPYTWRFRTAASSGIGYFTDYVTSLNNQADLSTCVALGDVNGDGDVDIAIGNRTQVGRIFVNNGSGSFSAGATFGTVTQETYALIFCDVDRDGDLDLVMGNYEQQNKIYLNNGTGSFSSSINFGTGSDRTAALATADVNNDGWPDIITVNYQQQSSVYINSGGTNFSAFIDFGDSNAAGGAVDIGDMNNDGWLDFVVGNTSTLSPTGQNYVYLNDGSGGSFIPIAIGPDSGSTEGVTIGDLDNDGDLDVAWVNLSGQTSYYYFNDGNGSSYTQGGILGGGTNARRVVACDIDADGDLDLVVARNDQISSVYVNGGGSFGTTRDIGTVARTTYGIALADLNGNGSLDIVTANKNNLQNCEFFLNDTPVNTLEFQSATFSRAEGGGTATITVTRTGGNTGAVSVQYATSDGTATDGLDYTAASGTLNWASGDSTPQTFTVPITQDPDVEGDETVNLTLSSPTGGATLGAQSTATLSILDDESTPTVEFNASNYDVGEDGVSVTVTVMLSNPTSSVVTVNYATSDGTASSGSDYIADSDTLPVPQGEVEATFNIIIFGDGTDEPDETIILTLSSPVNATLGAQTTSTVTIIDDDETPEVAFSAANIDFDEATGDVTVTVGLNAESSTDVTVEYATSDGTATAGSDYTAIATTILTVPAGDTSATFDVGVLGDLLNEANETINLTLTNPVGATLGTQATMTITITNNDAVPNVKFNASNIDFTEGAGNASITVTLSAASGQEVRVNYATSNGTAIAGSDYTTTNGTLIFSPLQTSKNFQVPVLNDSIAENSETANLTLSAPVNATLGTPSTATLTILDTDADPTVQFSAANFDSGENVASAVITVTLSSQSGKTITVNYATSDGTATQPGDYATASNTLTFTAGQTSKTFNVTVVNDGDVEGNETVNLTLSGETNATLGAQSTATLTILDDDTTPDVEFDSATYTVDEAAGTVTLNIVLTNPTPLPVAVNYATSNGTAVAPGDYTSASNVVNFAANDVAETIVITVTEDLLDELDETFTVTLSSPVNANLGAIMATVVTITDNDAAPTVQLSAANVNVGEGAGTATVTVNLSAASGQDVTVQFDTSDGTAAQPGDYTTVSQLLTITSGNTSTTQNITIADDGDVESSETINIALTSPTNATLGTPGTGTVTILDNDTMPVAQFSAADYAVTEGTATVTITVSLDIPAPAAVSVNYATADNSAIAGSDYTATSGTLNIAESETSGTFTVPITNNSIGELVEIIDLALSAPVGVTLGAQNTATVTITDNDIPTVQFQSATVDALEDIGTAQVTVTLSNASDANVSVNSATSNGSAVQPGDYTASSGPVSFIPGETSKTFDVPIINDGTAESTETIILTLTGPSNATLGTQSTMTLRILDNDTVPTVQFAVANIDKTEDATTATVTVNLSVGVALPVDVTYATSDGTATDPADYTAATSTLNFVAFQTVKTFNITIAEDTLDENDETINLALSAPVNATLGAQSTSTITILDDDPLPTVKFSAANVNFTEANGNAVITVELDTASGRDVTVNYATSNGTASAGTDYTSESGSVTITAGSLTATFDIAVIGDSSVEANETVNLTLTSPVNALLGSPSTSTLTIVDNDAVPQVNLPDATEAALESDGVLTIRVTLTGPSTLTVTVPFTYTNGSATIGSDFNDPGTTLDFLPDEVEKTFDIPLVNDGDTEGNETFTIQLGTPTNATIGSLNSMQGRIVDDESLPNVAFSAANTDIGEAGGSQTITVNLSASSWLDVTVNYATTDGTATQPGDYTTASGTLTIAAGQTSATFDVTVINDTVTNEGDETVNLTLSVPDNAVLGAQSTATITIQDNDVMPEINLGFANLNVNETSGTIPLTATLTNSTGATVTVTYTTSDNGATAGEDYTAVTDVLTFNPGETEAFFDVEILDDGLDETATEKITITLSGEVNATLGVQSSATITIIDDDDPPPAPPPVFNSLVVTDADNFYKAGDQISLLADLGETGLTVRGNLTVVDTGMSSAENFTDLGNNTYSFTSIMLSSGTMVQGVNIPVTVTATNGSAQSSTQVVLLTIDKTAPTGQFTYSAPSNNVPEGTLNITLTYNEAMGTLPAITITGLGGGLDVTNDPMTGAVPGATFTYAYVIPPATSGTATITISNASDRAGNAGSTPSGNVLTVTGGSANLTANAGSDQNLTLLQTVTLNGTGSTGATSYTWTQISGPSVTINNSTSATATFNATSVGAYAFKLQVSNGVSNANDTINVTIPNFNPVVSAGIDLSFESSDVVIASPNRTPLGLNAIAYDPNGDTLYSTWVLSSGPTGGNLSIASPTALASNINVSGSAMVPGIYIFELQVADPTNQQAGTPITDQLRIEVLSSTLLPPAAHSGMDQIVQVGNLVTLSGNESADPDAVDPENPVLTFAWQIESKPLGSGASLTGAATKYPTFTPDVEGEYVIFQTVTDPDGLTSGADYITIYANDESGGNMLSRAVIAFTYGDSNSSSSLNVNEQVTLNASGSVDGDGDTLTYQWEQIAGPVTIVLANPGNVSQVFTPITAGSYRFRVTPNDGQDDGIPAEVDVLVASGSFKTPKAITKLKTQDDSNGDKYVTFIPGVGVNNDPGNPTIELDGASSTKDGSTTLTYRWTQTLGPTVGIVNANASVASITPMISRTYEFELEVKDGYGIVSTARLEFSVDTWHATANPTGNSVPKTDPIPDQNATQGQLITLVATSTDPDGDAPVAYIWVQTAGAPVVLDTSVFGQASFTAPITGTYTFLVYVDDGADIGLPIDVQVFVGTVEEDDDDPPPPPASGNTPPDAVLTYSYDDADGNGQLNPGESVTLDGSASFDEDGDDIIFTWEQRSGPETVALNDDPEADTQTITLGTAGTYRFRLRVYDGEDESSPADVLITVSSVTLPPPPPEDPPSGGGGGDSGGGGGGGCSVSAGDSPVNGMAWGLIALAMLGTLRRVRRMSS